MHVTFTGAGRDALDAALSRAPLHLRPLFLALRDGGCGLVLVAQGRERFAVPIAAALGTELDKAGRTRVKNMLRSWLATGMFVVVEGTDEKRNKRSFIEVGEAASD